MPTPGRPKLTVRLDEEELRLLQAMAYNAGTTGAELARSVLLDYIQANRDAASAPAMQPEDDRG
jgi:hypothetical protein